MTFSDYSRQAITTDLFASQNPQASSPAFMSKILGLVGEAGEVAEKFKKILRDKEGILSDEDKAAVIKELGDVLWYINAISCYMGVSLEDVANRNLDKVLGRKQRGTGHGSGDNR